MGDQHLAVYPFLNKDVFGIGFIEDQIKLFIMGYGRVVIQAAFGLAAENLIQLYVVWQGAMQIAFFYRFNLESSVMSGKVVSQEPVCLFNAFNTLKPQLFYQAVLEGPE